VNQVGTFGRSKFKQVVLESVKKNEKVKEMRNFYAKPIFEKSYIFDIIQK